MINKVTTPEERRELVAREAARLKAERRTNPSATPSARFLSMVASGRTLDAQTVLDAVRVSGPSTVSRRTTSTTGRTSTPSAAHVHSLIGGMHGLPANAAETIAAEMRAEKRRKDDDDGDECEDEVDDEEDKTLRRMRNMFISLHGEKVGEELYQRLLAGEGGPEAA
ncbi:MAG TPA: hypothetical protein VMI54_04210 [Polyangiaceae bacterium]|nr:hypothetical protein [Polyangiaceae bacterium]